MKTRRLPILLTGLFVLVLVGGCAQEPVAAPTPTPAPEASVSSATPPAEVPASDVTKGTVGSAATLGSWTVTVRDTESESGDDSAKSGLKVEVDLKNNDTASLSVGMDDWSAVDASGQTYAVTPSSRADKQGERTIPAGKTEDVTVSFDVPSGGTYILRFMPANGGPGTLEVPLP